MAKTDIPLRRKRRKRGKNYSVGGILMKIGYIVNPVAGKKNAARHVPRIEQTTKDMGYEAAIYITDRPGDAVEKTAEAVREGCDVVVAVGGDGTVNEVVNGLDGISVVMGVIPAGSGNDFSRTLRIPQDFEGALDCILKGRTRTVDVGTVNGKRFVNVASIGFDTQVVMETNRIKKRIPGPLAYVLGVFKALTGYKAFDIELETKDNIIRKRAALVAVANGMFYGGGMKIAPRAVVDDGLFDVCLVEDMRRLRILRLFPIIYSGRHLLRPEVKYFRTTRIRIECLGGYINSDGEIIGPCPADMVLQAGGLVVIVP
jgi:YegS/Rv2252/BmrU family lipid kinase